MVAEFRWLYTAVGLAKRAAAEAGGAWPQIVTFSVGDGGGVSHEPEDLLGGLINETWRGPVNRRYVHALEPNLVVVEAPIPADQGGWTIREAGLIDEDDDLIAVGKYPATEKPAPGSGGEKLIYVRGGVRISNGGDLVVQIGTDLVMATQEYVDAHAALTSAHESTSVATANKIMQRDAAGRAKVAAPAAADDIARKDTVDTHGNLTSAHDSTSAATANKIAQRDGSGRLLAAAAAVNTDQLPNMMQFLASKAANGYQKLPSGLIIQWGRTGIIGMGGSVAVTFPIAFPTAALMAISCPTNGGVGASPVATPTPAANLGTTSFVIYGDSEGAITSTVWFAIGY